MNWLGNAFILIGLYLIGNKKRYAFLFSVVGEALWMVWSIRERIWSLALITLVFAALAIRSYIKWGQEGQ